MTTRKTITIVPFEGGFRAPKGNITLLDSEECEEGAVLENEGRFYRVEATQRETRPERARIFRAVDTYTEMAFEFFCPDQRGGGS